MTISIWRYSHLILALISSLFLLALSVTGVILAVEPISNKLHLYSVKGADQLRISEKLINLNGSYEEILSISQDSNMFARVSAIVEQKNEEFYVDPFFGEQMG